MLSKALVKESPNSFLDGLLRLAYGSPIYKYSLVGRTPSRLLGTPPELMAGNAAYGQSILAGSFVFEGRRFNLTTLKNLHGQFNRQWPAYFHSFQWLSDLRRVGSQFARHRAQALITEWISTHNNWDSLCWRPDILGSRLANWTTHFAFFTVDADQTFLKQVLSELGRQSRHLSRSVAQGVRGHPRIIALKGLIYAGIALPESDNYLIQGLEQLETEIARQVYPDGGHISRNPKVQMDVMRDLVEVREALSAAHILVPVWMKRTIERMVPMLRGMRLGDGSIAHFHSATSVDPEQIDALLTKANVRCKPFLASPHAGFHRLAAGKSVLILDTGKPPAQHENRWGHAGTLSFEMSVGKERLIVNCGSTQHMGEDWRRALRATAAHSTMTVDDVNSAELNFQGGFLRAPLDVHCNRRQVDGKAMIEAISDGYMERFDLIHRRILVMSTDGIEILGEDRLEGTGGHSFTLRFHLHPNVQVTLIQHGKAALLKLRRGPGWKIEVSDRELSLEDSVYVDGSARQRRSQQVTVSGKLQGRGASVKWSLIRI